MVMDGGPGWGSASGTATLTTIPRYMDYVWVSQRGKSINSISLDWSSSHARDWTQYSVNGGTWTDAGDAVNSGNKSGYFTISGLNPYTTYSIRVRVRRTDSKLWSESSSFSVTTYDIASITSAPNINIGSSHTIQWTNPSGASTSLKLCKTDNTQVINYGTVTGTSKSITPTASTIYALTPNSNSITLRYVITTTANGKSYTHYKNVVFTVTNSNPTFSNCTYKDMGSVSTRLTGDNQTIINGFNGLQVTISTANKAVAKNGATMSKYRLVCGSKSVEASYSSSADVSLSLDYITNMTFIVYAIDSRGNSTAVTKSVSTWKDYSDIKIKTGSATRDGGVGTQTTLTFEGELWNDSFGAESNGIVICQYKYKKTNESTYGSSIDIIPTVSGNTFSFSSTIKGDVEAEGFNVSNSFNIQVIVTDKIKTTTYEVLLGAGTPAMAIGPNGIAFGGPYVDSEGGYVQFPENQYISGKPAINLRNSDIVRANCIWMNDESTGKEGINFLKEGVATGNTDPDNYDTLRVYRGNAYVGDRLIAFLDAVYPVGSIYMSVKSTNPSSLFGGTWVAWGTGRVPVGIDTSQTEFKTVEKTGGAKTHKLTVAQMPSHRHSVSYNNNNSAGTTSYPHATGGYGDQSTDTDLGFNQVGLTGGGEAHNNLQPYITCYMWKRTA